MKVPEKTTITITTGGKPIEGVPVKLIFEMAKKNHHIFVFGPSDSSGTINVTADEIRREARKTMELFLMDFTDIEAHWTGRLRIVPMNRQAIKAALSAFRQFRSFKFPANYEQMLLAADAILSRIPTAKLEASVRSEPDKKLTLEAVPVQAEEEVSAGSDSRPN